MTKPVVAFDHHSEAHARDWEANYRQLRETAPVAWSESHGGYWILSGYDDVAAVARDFTTFASGRFSDPDGKPAGGIAIPSLPFRVIPTETDQPDWHRMRRLLNPALGPTTVQRYRRRAEEYANLLVDRHIEAGCMDLVLDLANPLPAIVTLELLGIPLDEWTRFAEPFHLFPASPPGSPGRAAAEEGVRWIYQQVLETMAARRSDPRDDMVTLVIGANRGEDALSEAEMADLLLNLIGGGVDTTTSLASNALWHLHRHHADRDRLIEDPSLLREAIEEFLRFYTPIQTEARTATRDCEIGGQRIAAGDRVLMAFSAANRDPAAFDDPETFLLDRFPNRHLAFGMGIHRCVGSHLARLMFEVMITTVLRRLPDYAVDESKARRYPAIGTILGWATMPVAFTPARRVGSTLSLDDRQDLAPTSGRG